MISMGTLLAARGVNGQVDVALAHFA
jgi:hypothetical protein